MIPRTLTLGLVAAAGCGRIGFGVVGGGDAGAGGSDAPPAPFCASLVPQPTFCSDFDGSDPMLPWTAMATPSGTVAFEAGGTSAPRALVVRIPAKPAGASQAELYTSTIATTQQLTARFAARVDTVGTSEPVLLQLELDDGAQYHYVEYVYQTPPLTGYIEDVVQPHGGNQVYTYFDLSGSFDAGAWHVISLALDVGTVPARLVVQHDGTTVLDTPPAVTTGGDLNVQLGVTFLGAPSEAWQIRFDDVVVDAM